MKAKSLQAFLQSKSVFLWLILAVAIVLLVPFVAMQYSADVNWSALDFITIAILLLAMGLAFIFLGRSTVKRKI